MIAFISVFPPKISYPNFCFIQNMYLYWHIFLWQILHSAISKISPNMFFFLIKIVFPNYWFFFSELSSLGEKTAPSYFSCHLIQPKMFWFISGFLFFSLEKTPKENKDPKAKKFSPGCKTKFKFPYYHWSAF